MFYYVLDCDSSPQNDRVNYEFEMRNYYAPHILGRADGIRHY